MASKPMTMQNTTVDTDHDTQIAELVETVRCNQERIAGMQLQIEQAKLELSKLLKVRGTAWTDEHGYARLVADGERISYATKDLDTLLIENPLQYGWLKDFRKRTPVRGGVQVR